jgi:hypothetical protein
MEKEFSQYNTHNPIPYPAQILCYFFTTLGNQIASFYERDLIPQGHKNFESLIESAKRKGYGYSETELTEADYSTLRQLISIPLDGVKVIRPLKKDA